MNDSTPNRPHRRPRYPGTHPRGFREKYKEHDPARYPDDVAKIVDSGKTPAGTHRPIMVQEIMQVLAPRPGDVAVDCTLGYGGHATALLKAVQPGGRLLAVDADPIELPKTEARLRGLGYPPESLVVRRLNYAGIAKFIAVEAPGGADVILADLGLSSMQIDDPQRGFTFKKNGPLDMRMNPTKGRTAAELLSTLDRASLTELLAENADEPRARELATAIRAAHKQQPLTTTQDLAYVVRATVLKNSRRDPDLADDTVRRVFQALRIAVNDELGSLDAFLRQLPMCLRPGGRVAVLTFHSGEDRRVKLAFKQGLRAGTYSSIASDVIRATPSEQRANPRSSSAKLRFAVASREVSYSTRGPD